MSTNQLWQVVAWPLAWPGKNHVHIRGVGVNGDNVSVTWYLRANDHKGEFESKAVVAEQASKLNNEGFLTSCYSQFWAMVTSMLRRRRLGSTWAGRSIKPGGVA
ncbi:hypothetical protein [Vulcanisaeta distributa]|uniref:hypothetical protein n=1 Tax=Vulcanisaeta distributa TaxID=164451 RepID=UPI001FB4FFEA|nr:hypothetical protein [Vulcanisaeta distributa]